ncbi:MAG: hypothetical protein AAFY28_03045 [Actinomycetota bacterium]
MFTTPTAAYCARRRLLVMTATMLAIVIGAAALAIPSAPASALPESPTTGATVDVATGNRFTCIRTAQGNVKCWGVGLDGQLGQGDADDRGDNAGEMGDNLPFVDLGTGRTAREITAGSHHVCALLDNGDVKCWGSNNHGKLGLGDMENRGDDPGEMGDNLPAVDLGNRRAVAIAAGGDHTCALLNDTTLRCWGRGSNGQLGSGSSDDIGDDPGEMGDSLPAVDLGSGRRTVSFAVGGSHNCAILDNDDLKCWGGNWTGQLGLRDAISRGNDPGEMGDNLPAIDLGAGRTATLVAAGAQHNCAVLDDTTVKCWGRGNGGALGYGSTKAHGDEPHHMGDTLPPVDLGTGLTPIALDLGAMSSCARFDDHAVKCWGANSWGVLAQGDTESRGDDPGEMGDNLAPIDVGGGRFVTALSINRYHVCAALDDNSLKCWGQGARGGTGGGHVKDIGDEPAEKGNGIAVVDLGSDQRVDPAGVTSFVPQRLIESRPGRPTVDGLQQNIGMRTAGQVTEVQVAGRAGVGPHVDAVIANIGIVAPKHQGFATAYPCDKPRPEASTINYAIGQTVSNAATIALSASGTFCVFTQRATDLIVDLTAVVPIGSTVDTITPARFVETRLGRPTSDGDQEGIGRRTAGQETAVVVAGRNGVPADADTATINAAAIDPDERGYVAAYPCGGERPETSIINYQKGQTIAGGATIRIGDGGAICFYTHRSLDLVVDVTAHTTTGSVVDPMAPVRLVESRPGRATVDGAQEGIGRRAAGEVTTVQVRGRAGVTGAATAGVFSIAAVDPELQGYVSAYPCDENRPEASNLNHQAGRTIANNATIELSDAGTICIYTHRATDLIVDLTGTIR